MAVTKRIRFEVLRRDGHMCRYCGARAPEVKLTVDHVLPTALGGGDDPTNLVTACADCNAGKTSIAPGSPLVAEVAADAIRWSAAMRYLAEQANEDRGGRMHDEAHFDQEWMRWTGYQDRPFERPAAWEVDLHRWMNAGLTLDDLIDLVPISMRSQAADKWRYLAGCAWNRVRDRQDQARELIASGRLG